MKYIENIFNDAGITQNGYTDSAAVLIGTGDAPLWKFAVLST